MIVLVWAMTTLEFHLKTLALDPNSRAAFSGRSTEYAPALGFSVLRSTSPMNVQPLDIYDAELRRVHRFTSQQH
jgi:hypothetical protein